MQKLKPKAYLVEWEDAWTENGWQDIHDLEKKHDNPLLVKSIGFAFHENKKGLTLVSGFSEAGTPLNPTFIPKKMIRKINKIRY